ncbi:MAG TPA: PilZ domain-containing protein [Thermoanaerobaculia bacterium]|nr:PilZ domain-containing protein [Thermoanaerobaculia bacterium]HXK66965.1 PilZ domain-containing protein [Thermoanaerobaculia bacterium]
MERRALIVELPVEVYARILPVLTRGGFSVDRLTRAQGASSFILHQSYDLILMGYPVSGRGVQDLFEILRWEDSPCLHTPLLMFSHPAKIDEARKYVGRGASRVMPINSAAQFIMATIEELLYVAPRLMTQIMVRLDIPERRPRGIILCQTINLSATGMLVQTGRRLDIGDLVNFEFILPGDKEVVHGSGEIVRHTLLSKEKSGGMAIKFTHFDGDSDLRLSSFISGRCDKVQSENSRVATV